MTIQPDTPRNRGDLNAPHMSLVTPSEDLRTIMINRVGWGAVLAGTVVALVTQLILNLLGLAFGAATINPVSGTSPSASSFSTGAGVYFALAGILAALAGGYAAGRLSGKPKASTAGWHGLTSWGVSILVIACLMTSTVGGALGTLSGALGGVASAIGATAQTAAQVAAPAVAGEIDPFSSIEQSLRSATGSSDPGALADASVAAVRAVVSGDETDAERARERATQALARSQGIPVAEARAQVQEYEREYLETVERAEQEAAQAADVAAEAISIAALLAGISLILGALASWIGGRMGAVEPTITV